jgi:hypothetical protein
MNIPVERIFTGVPLPGTDEHEIYLNKGSGMVEFAGTISDGEVISL